MRKLMMVAAVALALTACADSQPAAQDSAAPAQVRVTDAYILPNGDVAGMFGEVVNDGPQPVRLTGGSAPGVGMVQVHEYVTQGSKETMREVPGGLEVPAGGSVQLEPGGYHVMMMDVTADWTVGDPVPVTLDLSDGQSVTVQAVVAQREGMEAGGMQ